MRTPFFFIVSLLVSVIMAGCISDDVTYSPDAKLSFSRDTLSFDTIFTDLGSQTARLRVFNRNNKAVNISSIRVRGDEDIFSINVDGVTGKVFNDVEIRANDSIYIFVECFLDENDNSRPFLVEGQLDFETNGNLQTVTLEAYGQNVTRLRNATIEGDVVFDNPRPYVVFDTLRVTEGATLTLAPGTQMYFHDKGMLQVDGCLRAIGAEGKMIQMRGDRLGNVLTDTGYEILAGQWQGIRFGAKSFGNRMEYVEMQSTVHGVLVDSCGVLDRDKLTLVNSWLHNSQVNVLRSAYAKVDAYGCVFSDAGEATVHLTGGVHDFTQCTLANYYLFAISPESILTLSHVLPKELNESENPLMKAEFRNSIIYGITSPLTPGDLNETDVYFRNVLLGVEGSDDEHFISCLWDEDPLFETIRNDYLFDYRLKEDSPAIGAGNPEFVTPIDLYDMLGVDRLANGNPALGALAR